MRALLYKPFGIVAGIAASRISRKAFNRAWESAAGTSGPPGARSGEATLPRVVAAAALQGATFAATRAAVDRATASSFHHLFGTWPEKTRAEKQAEQERKDAEKAAKSMRKAMRA